MITNKETGKFEWQYLNKNLWYSLEEELGEITDVIIQESKDPKMPVEVFYKSNGRMKMMHFNNYKTMLHCIMYCITEFNVIAAYRKFVSNEDYDKNKKTS